MQNNHSSQNAAEAAAEDAAAEISAPNNTEPNESHGMIGSAFIVGIMTLLSRLTGLWRFGVMAHYFGATPVADAFNFAFIFPNLTRRLFGEGLLTSVFVPVFSARLAKGEKEAANRTASVLLVRLGYWLSLGCVACIAVSLGIRLALSASLPPERVLEFKLFEALLPYCVLINLAAVLMAILNSLGHFWMPAFAPVLLNLMIVAACYFGLDWFGKLPTEQIWVVAVAVLLGGAVQFLIQLPTAFARGFRFQFSADKSDPGYSEVMANFKPVVLMVVVFQVNVLMDNLIAQWFIPGSGPVTYMNMGTSVYQMAWSMIALAIGVAALPLLSRQWAVGDKAGFRRSLTTALRYAVFAALPCTIGAMLLSPEIVRFLYGTGKFLADDGEPVRRTAGVVFYSCLGLVFYSVNSILVRALYAMKDMKTPTSTMCKSVGLNFVLNLFFVLAAPKIAAGMYESIKVWAGPASFSNDAFNMIGEMGRMRESGITLASTISTAWQTWMLASAVRKQMDLKPDEVALTRKFSLQLFGVAAASALLGLGVYRYKLMTGGKDEETLFAFAYGAVAFGPLIGLNYWYFEERYKALRSRLKLGANHPVPENEIPDALTFQHALFTSLAAAAIMGLFVWATRESMPEGHTQLHGLQRAVAPVIIGALVYSMAASSLMSREHEELWGMMLRKLGFKR